MVYSTVDVMVFMVGDNIIMNWLSFKASFFKFQDCNLSKVMKSKGR